MLDSLTENEGLSLEFEITAEQHPVINILDGDTIIAHSRPVLVNNKDGSICVGALVSDVYENGKTLMSPYIGNVLCLENQLTDAIPNKSIKLVQCCIYTDGRYYGTGMLNNAVKLFSGSSRIEETKLIISHVVRS